MADNRPVPLIHFTQNCEWSTKVYNGQWCRILLLTKITKLFLKFSRRINFELHIEYEHHIRNPLSCDTRMKLNIKLDWCFTWTAILAADGHKTEIEIHITSTYLSMSIMFYM